MIAPPTITNQAEQCQICKQELTISYVKVRVPNGNSSLRRDYSYCSNEYRSRVQWILHIIKANDGLRHSFINEANNYIDKEITMEEIRKYLLLK